MEAQPSDNPERTIGQTIYGLLTTSDCTVISAPRSSPRPIGTCTSWQVRFESFVFFDVFFCHVDKIHYLCSEIKQ